MCSTKSDAMSAPEEEEEEEEKEEEELGAEGTGCHTAI